MTATTRCRRCGALIRWEFTAAEGRRIPIDEIGDDDGNVYLGPVPGDGRRLAYVDDALVERCLAGDPALPGEVVMPHHATCGGRRPRPRAERIPPPPPVEQPALDLGLED